jgi:hypothetical protein
MLATYFDKRFTGGLWIYVFERLQNGQRQRYKINIEKADKVDLGQDMGPSVVLHDELGDDLLRALCEGLELAGLIPQRAVDAELKATKCHLEATPATAEELKDVMLKRINEVFVEPKVEVKKNEDGSHGFIVHHTGYIDVGRIK